MAITQDEINRFRQKAIAAGYSEDEIQKEIARKQSEPTDTKIADLGPSGAGMDVTNPPFQTSISSVEPEPQETQKGGLFSNVSNFVKNIPSTFFPATTTYFRDIFQTPVARERNKMNEQTLNQVEDLMDKARKETDSKRKAALYRSANQISGNVGAEAKDISKNFSEYVERNPFERGVAVGAEVAPLVLAPTAKGATAAGRVGSAALQGGALSGARTLTSLEEKAPEERLKDTLISAGLGALVTGGLQAGGEIVRGVPKATTKTGEKISEGGTKLREGVRKIKEPAGVWGADKERAINETLNKLDLQGNSAQQYSQLSEKYDALTNAIDDYLDESVVATNADDISNQVLQSLDDIPGDVLGERGGAKEAEKIIKEIGKTQNSKDIFGVKKWLNGRLGRVYSKLERGNPLSPAEEVILQARDTVDDVISNLHPEIKQLTIQQSHLRDAAPSLSRARFTPSTTRVAGTTVPSGVIPAVQDTAGRAAQEVGGAIERVGQLQTAAGGVFGGPLNFLQNIARRVVPTLVSPTGEQGQEGQQTPTNENGQQNQGNENIFPQDTGIVPTANAQTQYTPVTGRSIEQHRRALSKATAAGDTNAVKQIKAQLDIEESNYKNFLDQQKAKQTGAGSVGKVTPQAYGNAQQGMTSLKQAYDTLFDQEGNLDKGVIIALKSPNQAFNQKAKQLKAYLYSVADANLRLKTGAVANQQEIQRLADSLEPGITDDANTVKAKLGQYAQLFNIYLNMANQGGIGNTTLNLDNNGLTFDNGASAF